MNGLFYDFGLALVERKILGKLRAQLLSPLRGTIVDVGAGTGANLPYFNAGTNVIALEPDRSMAQRLEAKLARTQARVELRIEDDSTLDSIAERSVDAVLATLVLCTIPDPAATLRRVKRILKPTGTLVILEHVRSPGTVGKLQDVLAPAWRIVADGCNLNRDTKTTIAKAGFDVHALRTERFIKVAPIQYLVYGAATVR